MKIIWNEKTNIDTRNATDLLYTFSYKFLEIQTYLRICEVSQNAQEVTSTRKKYIYLTIYLSETFVQLNQSDK